MTDTIWLHKGIVGDDTHGHVDDLARFTDERTVVTAVESNKSDPNHEILQREPGNPQVPQRSPSPHAPHARARSLRRPAAPASYANFYIANELVLVPTFTDKNDAVALNTIRKLFPKYEVVGIPCRDLVLGLGTLHCMTMQQPA